MKVQGQAASFVEEHQALEESGEPAVGGSAVLEMLLEPLCEDEPSIMPSDGQEKRPGGDARRPGEIVLGTLQGVGKDGEPTVVWPGGPEGGRIALSLVPLGEADRGRAVALSFPRGSDQPLVMGLVWHPEPVSGPPEVELDGQTVTLEATRSLVLRCGKASIVLTADGQVLVRGSYVSSHATGTQRIKGAAVRIN